MTDMALHAHQGAGWTAPARPRGGEAGRGTARRREFRAYFALLMAIELPAALAVWTLTGLRRGAWPEQGPLDAARSRAALVASLILSA